jgi:hypothetical protein
MQTFSQYAATRPLRRPSSATVAVQDEQIQTFAGVDVVTGMPVIVYTMNEAPPNIPEVYSESIPIVLESGMQDQTGFVVVSSAPGYLPLRLGLSQTRIEWLSRISAKALADAHAGGLVHGDLCPDHFFVQGDHLLLEGWGLNWHDTQPDFMPPEGQGAAAADVFAWARTMQAYGKGDPRKLLDGEMGRLIGHCLNPKPQERPTALELVIALEQVIAKKILKPEVKTVRLNQETERLETQSQVDPEPETPDSFISKTSDSSTEGATETLPQTKLENPLEMPPSENLEPEMNAAPQAPVSQPPAPQPLKLEPQDDLHALTPIDEGVTIIAKTTATEATVTAAKAEQTVTQQNSTTTAPIQTPVPAQIPDTPVVRGKNKSSSKSKTLMPSLPPEVPVEHELREPENLAADEPDIVPSARPEPEPIQLPTATEGNIEPGVVMYKDGEKSNTIRVGFDEDDSWRSVKTYQPPKPNTLLIAAGLGVALVVVITLIVSLTRGQTKPRPSSATTMTNPASGSIVNFVVQSSGGQTARLTVVSAPLKANLKVGSLLATIPGPVLFPVPGEYRVRVTMPKFVPGELVVNVPQDANTSININLRQP